MSAYKTVFEVIASHLDPSGEHSSSGLIGQTAAAAIAALAQTADHKQMLRDAKNLSRVASATIGPATQPEGRCAEHIVALLAEVAHLQPAPTPRHEAPFFIKDGEDPAEFRALGKRLADTDHEAPAEGAGEAAIAKLFDAVEMADDYNRLSDRPKRLAKDFLLDSELRDAVAALRARSSAPEAHEGEAVAWINPLRLAEFNTGQASQAACFSVRGEGSSVALYTHPAAPSADKLRTALSEIRDGMVASRDCISVDDWIELADEALKGDAKP